MCAIFLLPFRLLFKTDMRTVETERELNEMKVVSPGVVCEAGGGEW